MLAALAVVAAVAGGVGAAVSVTHHPADAAVQAPVSVVEQPAPSRAPVVVHSPREGTSNPFLEVDGL